MKKKNKITELTKYPKKVESQDINHVIKKRRLKRNERIKYLRDRWNEMINMVNNR